MNKILILVSFISFSSYCQQLPKPVQFGYTFSIINSVFNFQFNNDNYNGAILGSQKFGTIVISNPIDFQDFITKLREYGNYTNRVFVVDHFGPSYDIALYGSSPFIFICNFYTENVVFKISKANALLLANQLESNKNLMN